ncbi:GNAT family N-acetyltransferase [Tenggerimyces flavus]|uniref:GNAT family N-acetyltransferase n=1 Tax=Tenggerimyces flavus TaxID=1708749 RepID=A0ABV7YBK3_9ACTN|nr:GNAT family N-acetyltransferase [Tenggerimyces flavus]MBM7783699.1 GNAT superfamily N-acetyltransferase [Tenggerimyces flavus]
MGDLERAVANAAALWTALAESREQEHVRTDSYLVVEGGRRGRRVMVLSPSPSAADVDELKAQATRPSAGGVTFEDAYGAVDLSGLGLVKRQLAVMIRQPSPLPELPTPVVKIALTDDPKDLPTIERIAVDAFPLETFQPYGQGEAFPRALFERDEINYFVATREDVPVGITMTVEAGGSAGIYWVTTLPEHRSLGIGRALMHVVLEHHDDRPATLTAATAARPLYESLGFETLTMSSWWSGAPS